MGSSVSNSVLSTPPSPTPRRGLKRLFGLLLPFSTPNPRTTAGFGGRSVRTTVGGAPGGTPFQPSWVRKNRPVHLADFEDLPPSLQPENTPGTLCSSDPFRAPLALVHFVDWCLGWAGAGQKWSVPTFGSDSTVAGALGLKNETHPNFPQSRSRF